MTRADEADLAGRLLDALSAPDPDAAIALMHPDVEIGTARGPILGRDAAREWAAKRFDNLHRRYVVENVGCEGDEVVVDARLEYVWRDSDEVADASGVTIRLEVEDGLVKRWLVE